MAHLFNGGYFTCTTPPATVAPMTFYAQALLTNRGGISAENPFVVISDESFFNSFSATLGGATTALLEIGTRISNSGVFLNTSALNMGTFYAATAVFTSTTSRQGFLDTLSSAVQTNSRAPTGMTRLSIGQRYSTIVAYGQSAEVAVWNAALTTPEIASLQKGFSPRRIRPQSLVFYAPLLRNVQELRQGFTLTPGGTTPTVATHPRVY